MAEISEQKLIQLDIIKKTINLFYIQYNLKEKSN